MAGFASTKDGRTDDVVPAYVLRGRRRAGGVWLIVLSIALTVGVIGQGRHSPSVNGSWQRS